jgi:hypothetical protein
VEGILVGLSNQIEERFSYFEDGLFALVCRMGDMEVAFLHSRDPGPTQHSTSDSINLGRLVPNVGTAEKNPRIYDRGTTPMDIEEQPPNHSQNSTI